MTLKLAALKMTHPPATLECFWGLGGVVIRIFISKVISSVFTVLRIKTAFPNPFFLLLASGVLMSIMLCCFSHICLILKSIPPLF